MGLFRKLAVLATVAAALGCTTRPVAAQIPTYTTPQTVTAVLAPVGTMCTGAEQDFTEGVVPGFQNVGQTQHYVYISPNNVQTLAMVIEGIDASGDVYVLSDTQVGTTTFRNTLSATGYFPKIQIAVTCGPAGSGSFTLGYTGTSATSNQISGAYQIAQIDKTLAFVSPAGTGITLSMANTPFGSSQGSLYFQYASPGPAGSTLSITCEGQANGTTEQQFALGTTTVVQVFPLMSVPCPLYSATYTPGGASASTFDWEYIFQKDSPPPASYIHVTGTTATVVDRLNGVLDNIVVGTPGTGTITIFDLAYTACVGSPASNVVSVITLTAAMSPGELPFGSLFNNGICVQASTAMDFTVNYH
jgi:hypothetical protein